MTHESQKNMNNLYIREKEKELEKESWKERHE